jgi:hypothetical protein
MRKFIVAFILSIGLCLQIHADDKFNVEADIPSHKMEMVVAPAARFTGRWAIIVDASSSIWWKPQRGAFSRLQSAFRTATSAVGVDELYFCVYKFNDAGQEKYLKWRQGSVDAFKKAAAWISKNPGTFSHGKKSISYSLRQKVNNLTIIIITDGGFTSACYGKGFGEVESAIVKGQKWRVDKGFGEAIICTIGVENKDYWAGGKPSDEDCQGFLKKIGTKYYGGYFLVKKAKKTKKTKKVR